MAEQNRNEADADSLPSVPSDRELYTIPARSSWFLWDEIHEIERRSLSEFFDSSSISKNPRVYKEYRDFIINRYRQDTSRRLTFTDVRKFLIGDAGALRKVFVFLDDHGLINFSVSDKKGAPFDEFPPIVVEDGPPGGVRVVPHPNASKGISLPSHVEAKMGVEGGGRGFRLPPLSSYSDVFGNRNANSVTMCGDCGEQRASGDHELEKEGTKGFTICTKCSINENNKDTKSAEDLKLIDNANNEWSDVETLHLLEAIIAKKNDWALVSDQARKSKLECISRLIRLPLGEHVLNSISAKCGNKNFVNQKGMDARELEFNKLEKEPALTDSKQSMDIECKEKTEEDDNPEPPTKRRCLLSWSKATDSLMTQVANLSTIAGPHVAAAAAEAAIGALCNESPYAKKVFNIGDDSSNEFYSFTTNSMLDSLFPEHMDTEIIESEKWSEVAETSESNLGKNFGHLTFKIRSAIATAFGSVAAHAKLLGDQEDREIEHLMASIIEMQLKKIQLKIKHFDELEAIMEKEYNQLQQLKESVLSEWVGILQKANNAGVSKWRGKSFLKTLGDTSL